MNLFEILFGFKKDIEAGTGRKISEVRLSAGAVVEDLAKAGGLTKEERKALLGATAPSEKRQNLRVRR